MPEPGELAKLRARLGLPNVPGFVLPPRDPDDLQLAADRGRAGAHLFLLVIGQVLVNIAASAIWWYLGGPLGPLGAGVAVAAAVAVALDLVLRREIRSSGAPFSPGVRRWSLGWWSMWVGALAMLIVLTLVCSFFQLAWENRWFNALVVGVVMTALNAIVASHREAFYVSAAVLLTPTLVGWLGASLALGHGSPPNSVAAWRAAAVQRAGGPLVGWGAARCRSGRLAGEPLRVAVALSGGGYRAAVAHAGVLAALDEQCVRIDLLTTVSGGSIIGAAYALGVPPVEFAQQLAARKPGLASDMLLDAFSMVRELVLQRPSRAQREHFAKNFYGASTLADLPDVPLLLVNATDLEVDSYAAREVFFKGRAPAARAAGRSLDEIVTVADAVSASGAYPGAFQPVPIPWVAGGDARGVTVAPRRFVDGGVYENFGVEGLRRYLTLPRADGSLPPRPHILIISDASGYGTPGALAPRVDIVTLLSQSQRVAYEVFHRDLYVRYTGMRQPLTVIAEQPVGSLAGLVPYVGIDPELRGAPEQLVSVPIPITALAMETVLSRYPGCVFTDGAKQSAAAIQRAVRNFSTLAELGPLEVRQAFWLGYVIGTAYAPAIECARIRAAGRQCPETALAAEGARDAAATCPSYAELVRRHAAPPSGPPAGSTPAPSTRGADAAPAPPNR